MQATHSEQKEREKNTHTFVKASPSPRQRTGFGNATQGKHNTCDTHKHSAKRRIICFLVQAAVWTPRLTRKNECTRDSDTQTALQRSVRARLCASLHVCYGIDLSSLRWRLIVPHACVSPPTNCVRREFRVYVCETRRPK